MAEKITKIQIGADVRDIGLGVAAAWELGSSVMEQIAASAWGLKIDGTRLDVKTGEGLKVTVDSGVVLNTQWLFGTMKAHPDVYTDPENLIMVLAPYMGTFAGPGFAFEDNRFTVPLGSGLAFDNGKVGVNLGYGFSFGADGSLNINIGTGLKPNGSGEIIPHVAPNAGIVIDKYNGLALATEVVCRMLTQDGDGSVISNGSGLVVALGTALSTNEEGLGVDIPALLVEIRDSDHLLNLLRSMLGLD